MLAPKLLGLAISFGKNESGDDFGCGYAFTEMPIASIWPAHALAPPLFSFDGIFCISDNTKHGSVEQNKTKRKRG